jgi:hypothetical protein
MKRQFLTTAGLSAAVLLLAFGPAVAQTNRGGADVGSDATGGSNVGGDVKGGANVGGDVKGGANVKGGDNMPSASPNTSTEVKGDVKGDIKGGVNADSPSASPRIDDSTKMDNGNKAGGLSPDKSINKP